MTTILPWPTDDMVEVYVDPMLGMIADRALLDLMSDPRLRHFDAISSTTIALLKQNIAAGNTDLALEAVDLLIDRMGGYIDGLIERQR